MKLLRAIVAILFLLGLLFAIFAIRTSERSSKHKSVWERDYEERFEQKIPSGGSR